MASARACGADPRSAADALQDQRFWPGLLPPAVIGLLAAVLLLWGLDDKYLWQDEAQTAVLGTRLLRFGKPLAYDGVNLLTMDNFAAEDAASIGERTGSARAAVDYYIARGDMMADWAWRLHPWGQFVAAAAGIEFLGRTTLAARLPFALAALLTVFLFYRFVTMYFGSRRMASLAALMLVLNTYWILHSRQCRYYPLSCLFLVLTLAGYFRWQAGRKWGAAAFVLASWCWFQVDYGTVWPVWGVLFADAFIAQRRAYWRPLAVAAALAASIAPFVVYFRLWARSNVQVGTWHERFLASLWNTNECVAPLAILAAAVALAVARRKTLPSGERRAVFVAAGIAVAITLWIPSVVIVTYVRYAIMAAPCGAWLCAWFLIRAGAWRPWYFAYPGAMILIFTPWLSLPVRALLPPVGQRGSLVFRSELRRLADEVFGRRPDPNRAVVDWLAANAAPTDEILVNYEDIPLMYYLPNPIRGGIAAFRAEDDSHGPPRFVVLRRSMPSVHWPVFAREVNRYRWDRIPLEAPDIPNGNNPDPGATYPSPVPDLILLRLRPAGIDPLLHSPVEGRHPAE